MIKTSSTESNAAFYTQTTLCYGEQCRSVETPWVQDFDDVPAGSVVCVVSDTTNVPVTGVYVYYASYPGVVASSWRLALTMDDYVRNCSTTDSKIVILLNNTTTAPVPSTADKLFRNAQELDVGTPLYQTTSDVFLYIDSLEADTASSVTKPTPSTTEGVIQVSDGSDLGIKDWVPPESGLVKVDAAGKASIAEPGVDFSLPVDLQANNFPTDLPAVEADSPTLVLQEGPADKRTITLKPLYSGGGLPLGLVVINHE